MSINQRIKQIRKVCGWNQTEFATKLGVTQSGVSYMERDGSAISEQTVKSICMVVPGLNEEWLRTGTEPMYLPETTFNLDQFVKERGGTDLELEIVKAYFDLPKDVREAVMNQLQMVFAPCPSSDEREKLHSELDRQLEIEKTAREKSKAYSSTG